VTFLQRLRSVSKLTARCVLGGFARHTIRLKLSLHMLAMESHFFFQFAAELLATNENP
jgi:hypothetical protein